MSTYQNLLDSLVEKFAAQLPLLGLRAPEQKPAAPPSAGNAELSGCPLGARTTGSGERG